jgi:hypothetical protein
VDLTADNVERNIRLGPNIHANGDGEEIVAIERVALEDPAVKAEIAKLKLPEGTVVISDPWIYGTRFDIFNWLRRDPSLKKTKIESSSSWSWNNIAHGANE